MISTSRYIYHLFSLTLDSPFTLVEQTLPAWVMMSMVILQAAVDGCLVVPLARDGAGDFYFSFCCNTFSIMSIAHYLC